MKEELTNVQQRENGIITFTREITWLTAMSTGWGNGYVGLPKGHKHYGVEYEEIDVNVHGGLTYGQLEEIEGTEYWVVGFDCAHWGDDKETCPESYVIEQTEQLYQQLIS